MGTIHLPTEFEKSFLKWNKYPRNILTQDSYGAVQLKLLRERFKDKASEFLVPDTTQFITVKDILSDGRPEKLNLDTDSKIKQWLGIACEQDPNDPQRISGEIATKPDPRCRFVFLLADTVISPLKISLESLQQLLSYHQVSPTCLEYFEVYGKPYAVDRELHHCGFRTEIRLRDPHPGLIIPDLNRSGRGYQMCYNLKTVVKKPPTIQGTFSMSTAATDNNIWKIRQEVFVHQFDVGSGIQLWIYGDPHAVFKERVGFAVNSETNHRAKFETVSKSFATSLSLQLENARWATEGWREYIANLEEIVENLTFKWILSKNSRESRLDTDELFDVSEYEDQTNEVLMVLQSNSEILESLVSFYQDLVADESFPAQDKSQCQQSVNLFAAHIRQLIYDINMKSRRTVVLAKRVGDRKAIFIQLLQTQATERAEELTAAMWHQAEKVSYDAIAMRVITVVTLFYLPPTFVSTLFSTSIDTFSSANSGAGDGGDGLAATGIQETLSQLALQRFLEVTLPLMIITFTVTGFWFWYEKRSSTKRSARLKREYPNR